MKGKKSSNNNINMWTRKRTHRDAHSYRKVEDREKDLVEVIKYEPKIVPRPDEKRGSRKGIAKIYVRALDNIHAAMKGFRILDRFGFNLSKGSKREKTPVQLLEKY